MKYLVVIFGYKQLNLTSEYGGEWLRPDVGEISCMPRMPVGLANHPALNANWQLPVCHGRLNWRPVLPDFVCGLGKGVKQQAGRTGCSGRIQREHSEIAKLRACRLALSEAKKQSND